MLHSLLKQCDVFFFFNFLRCNFFPTTSQKVAKHCANVASNDVHRPPLGKRGEGGEKGEGELVISILQRLIVPWWPAVQFKVRGNIGDRGLSNTILEMSSIFIAVLIHLHLVQTLVHVVVSGQWQCNLRANAFAFKD